MDAESFIQFCDEISIRPAQESSSAMDLVQTGLIALAIIAVPTAIYLYGKQRVNTPKTNPRAEPDYYENEYARIDCDFWDEIGDYPTVIKTNSPTKKHYEMAKPLIHALMQYENFCHNCVVDANNSLSKFTGKEKPFRIVDPGKFCLVGNSKQIIVYKYIAEYRSHNIVIPYNSFDPKSPNVWKTVDDIVDQFEDQIYSGYNRTVRAYDFIKDSNFWKGDGNVDYPPVIDGRYYWQVRFVMNL